MTNDLDDLRQRAEARLPDAPSDELAELSSHQLRHLVRELQVHKEELRLQGEDLRDALVAEQILRDCYQDLYDHAPTGILELDSAGLIRRANHHATALLGARQDALAGRPLADFVYAEDQDRYHLECRQLMANDKPVGCELRLRATEREPVWVRLEGGPRQRPEDPTPLTRVMLYDMTEQIRARESLEQQRRELEALIEAVPIPLTLSKGGPVGLDYANKAFRELAGVSDEDLGAFDMGSAYSDPSARRTIFERVREQGEARGVLVRGTLPTWERERTFRLSLVPVSMAGDRSLLAAIEDVDELVQSREALRRHADLRLLMLECTHDLATAGPDELDDAIVATLERIARFYAVDSGYVMAFDASRAHFSRTHLWSQPPLTTSLVQVRDIPLEAIPTWAQAIVSNRPMVVPDLCELPAQAAFERAHIEAQGVRSLVDVPIPNHRGCWGFVGLASHRVGLTWTDGEIELLRLMGQAIATALERRDNLRKLERANRELEHNVATRTVALEVTNAQIGNLVEGLPGIVYHFTEKIGGSFYSKSTDAILGWSPEHLLAHPMTWHDAIHPDDLPQVDRAIDDSSRGDGYSLVYRIRDAHGRWRWLRDSSVGARRVGDNTEVTGFAQDITASKRAEQAKVVAEAALREQRALHLHNDQLRAVGELVAGMAHELRQPLLGIRGLAEQLSLGIARGWKDHPDDSRAMLDLIVQQADRMNALVDHVRLFARGARDPDDLSSPVELTTLLGNVQLLVGEQLRTQGLRLERRIAPDLPAARGNTYAIEGALLNLVANARDATLAAAPRAERTTRPSAVELEARHGGSGRGWVELRVLDRGGGIAPEVKELLGEPFVSSKPPDRGTGLGLYTARRAVEASGGRLMLEPRAGGGTAAIIVLPIYREPNP